MASLSLHNVGRLRWTGTVLKSSRLCPTYLMLSAGVFLVASVNIDSNQCILELLVDTDTNTTGATTVDGECSLPSMTPGERTRLDSLRTLFRVPRIIEVLEDEGAITCIELVRDYKISEGGKDLTIGRRRSLESLYVHLFIGTFNGTVFICNALRGTIMALAQFQYHGFFVREYVDFPQGKTGVGRHLNESVLCFAVHSTGPDTRLNANIAQGTSSMPMETLHSVYVVHDKGRVIVLDRVVLDVFLTTAENGFDGNRPYIVGGWSPDGNISSFPAAGPAAHFASHIEHVFLLSEMGGYSAVELQTMRSDESAGVVRSICDAAFFFSNKVDTTAILRDGPKAVESMLLCGEMPALSMYTFEGTRTEFSTRQTVKALVSAIGSVARMVWRGSSDSETTWKPKHLVKKPQHASDAFFEADLVFNAVQVDPTSQWAACYSEISGRIYLYDLMGGVLWRVMKGCRAAEFQWHLTTIAGKRILLLVIHLPLRHAIEVYSLRLGQRIAACHVPEGSVLLRPDSSSSSSSFVSVLLLTPPRGVIRLRVHYKRSEEEAGNLVSSVNVPDSVYGQPSSFRKKHERRSLTMPCDIIMKVFNLPLPVPVTDDALFDKYYSQMKELENTIKTHFSPGVSGDRCLARSVRIAPESVPRNITSAQSLNFVELRLVCVTNYRRALMMRPNSSEERQQQYEQDQKQHRQLSFQSVSSPSTHMMPIICEDGKVNLFVEQSIQAALEVFLANSPPPIAARLADVLPSIQRHLKLHVGSTCDKSEAELSPISLEEFLSFFHFCGYKLEFLHDLVREYDQRSDATRTIWAEIGAVFFGAGRGIGCLLQQLDVFSALGFHTLDVAVVALSWLCHTFVYSPTSVCFAPLIDVVFLLRMCSDVAFLSGIEQMTFLTNAAPDNFKRTEASLLFMILCIAIRQLVKPIGQTYYRRCSHLLQQLLLLRTLFNECESHTGQSTLTSDKRDFKKLRLGDLRLCDGGDTLNIWLFRMFDAPVAAIFCENTLGSDELKKSLAGVDMVELLKLLTIREVEDPNWTQKTPWFDDGMWNHSAFQSSVLQPLLTFVDAFMTASGDTNSVDSRGTPQQLAGLSTVLVSCLTILERELVPLGGNTLSFLQNNVVPDANLFEGGDVSSTNSMQHPKGSRSTRDYFSSCYELLELIQRIYLQLGRCAAGCECEIIMEAIQQLVSHDDDAVFSLIPVVIRLRLKKLMDLLPVASETLLKRFEEVHSFLKTVMFFAFTETGSRLSSLSSLPSQPLLIAWDSMFLRREIMFGFLSDRESDEALLKGRAMESRIKGRSTLLNCVVFLDLLKLHLEKSSHLAESLSDSLGLTGFVRDMPQLVLFDAAARQLFPGNELRRLLGGITSRHLAARIAAVDFKIIVTSCFRYYAGVKKSTPKENRSDLQRIALKLQCMDSVMSEECRQWIHSGSVKKTDAAVPVGMGEEDEGSTESFSPEYRLVACSEWYTPQLFRIVERKVWERLQLPRGSERLLDFNENLLTLARVASEGRLALTSGVRRFADELPSVATRLGAVFQDK